MREDLIERLRVIAQWLDHRAHFESEPETKASHSEDADTCRQAAAALEAAREDAWHTMESCPVNQPVLLWNQETGDMCFGYKPEDAPTVDAVVIGWTSSWADAWRPMPSEPESKTYDGPPQLSVVSAIDQARGKGVQS